jgi:two-component system KDP operon response regulator KdpE
MSKKILIIDGDSRWNKQFQKRLQKEGYQVTCAKNGQAGMRMFYTERPDLVVVDALVPKLDGYTVCQHIREIDDTPIIMMNSVDWLDDVVTGLDLGADDYVVKPVREGEFLARVRAALRRPGNRNYRRPEGYRDGYLSIDFGAHRVTVAGTPIRLTQKEHALLKLLVQSRGTLLSPAEILAKLWGPEKVNRVEFVRVYIQQLRRKLEPEPGQPVYLINEPNRGYRFQAQVQPAVIAVH